MLGYNDICFLDDDKFGRDISRAKGIGKVNEMISFYIEFEEIFTAIEDYQTKSELLKKVKSIKSTITTQISCYSSISLFVQIGDGCIVSSNVSINHDTEVKGYCLIYSGTAINARVEIEDNCEIGPMCSVGIGVTIIANSIIQNGNNIS